MYIIYKCGHRPVLMNWKQFERKQFLPVGSTIPAFTWRSEELCEKIQDGQ
jgi:hypothetical protein